MLRFPVAKGRYGERYGAAFLEQHERSQARAANGHVLIGGQLQERLNRLGASEFSCRSRGGAADLGIAIRKQPRKLRDAVETAGMLTAWSHLRGGRLALGPSQAPEHDRWPDLAEWCSGAAIDAGCDDPLIRYIHARTATGRNDPGFAESERMLSEAARAMEMDVGELRREVKKAGLAEEQ